MEFREFPKWLFHEVHGNVIVHDAIAEAEKLAAGWLTAQMRAAAKPNAPTPVAPPPIPTAAPVVPNGLVAPAAPPATPPTTGSAANADSIAADEKAELYQAAAKVVIAKLAGASQSTLEKVLAYEQVNPKGPRKSVVAALQTALGKIAAAAQG